MGPHAIWFLVVLGSSVAVLATCRLAAQLEDSKPARPAWRLQLGVLAGCSAVLVGLGVAYRQVAIAQVDGDVVAILAKDRNASLNGTFTFITTMGDVVPSFVIATLLAVLYYQQTGRVRGFVLQLMVLVQLLIQTAMTNFFHDVTMTDLSSSLPLGGSGTIPSGSVARLSSIFLVAATLWHVQSPRVERALLSLAPLLVLVEIVSRLYLGRHLLADIVAGLLLGLMLTIGFRWLLRLGDSAPVRARLRRSAARV